MLLPALPSASGPFVGPGDRYPNRQLKTKSVPVWLLADSQPHSLHSLKRFFWRRSIVINHFGSKGASPALPSAPPCTEARRGPILARKRWASGIAASTLSSSGAGPNPCSPTTKPEFPKRKARVEGSELWQRGFGDEGRDENVSHLVTSLRGIRKNAKALTSRIAASLPELTIHDVSHLDALWRSRAPWRALISQLIR